jgi:hypothetical protein
MLGTAFYELPDEAMLELRRHHHVLHAPCTAIKFQCLGRLFMNYRMRHCWDCDATITGDQSRERSGQLLIPTTTKIANLRPTIAVDRAWRAWCQSVHSYR